MIRLEGLGTPRVGSVILRSHNVRESLCLSGLAERREHALWDDWDRTLLRSDTT